MKAYIKNLFLWPALIAGLGLMLADRVIAQTFVNLHNFAPSGYDPSNGSTNSDGLEPAATLFLSGNALYGTAEFGGSWGSGTVFRLNTDGTDFTNLYSFTALSFYYTNADGQFPAAGLILSGDALYGTTVNGGQGGGTVFKVDTNGTGFTNVRNEGGSPQASLVLSGNTLYGTANYGGSSGNGSVFKINTDGTGSSNLYSFTATSGSTNSDGASPQAGLILSGDTLYGTAFGGGSSGQGTVFKLTTNGTGFTALHSFTARNFDDSSANFTNSDGAGPTAGLILSGNSLYGTASRGGTSGKGTVFRVNTDGTGFTNLCSFIGGSDGAVPQAGLVLSGNVLYGTASQGGISGSGTVFRINTDGTGFTNLHSFIAGSDGYNPVGGLILWGNTLYGTAKYGGSSGGGTVFALKLSPNPIPLNIQSAGGLVILTWSDPAFSLQAAPALNGIYTNVPAATSPYTNAIAGSQMFFRLQSN